jgi:hypothetical protein
MLRRFRNWVWAQQNYWKWRRRHNERDPKCTYRWRVLPAERCTICNPE